jgi:hypothetical protein
MDHVILFTYHLHTLLLLTSAEACQRLLLKFDIIIIILGSGDYRLIRCLARVLQCHQRRVLVSTPPPYIDSFLRLVFLNTIGSNRCRRCRREFHSNVNNRIFGQVDVTDEEF